MMNIKIQAEARSALYCSNLTYHLCAFDADRLLHSRSRSRSGFSQYIFSSSQSLSVYYSVLKRKSSIEKKPRGNKQDNLQIIIKNNYFQLWYLEYWKRECKYLFMCLSARVKTCFSAFMYMYVCIYCICMGKKATASFVSWCIKIT